jgi:malic enzyme
LQQEGVDGEQLRRAIITLDSRGVVSEDRADLDKNKRDFAWPTEWLDEIGLRGDDRRSLAKVVDAFKGNVLIGTSGRPAVSPRKSCATRRGTRSTRSSCRSPIRPTSAKPGPWTS